MPEISAEDIGYAGTTQVDPRSKQAGDDGIEVVKARTRSLDAPRTNTPEVSQSWGDPISPVDSELKHQRDFRKPETMSCNEGKSPQFKAQNIDERRNSVLSWEQFWLDFQQEDIRHMSLTWSQNPVLQAHPLPLDLAETSEGDMIYRSNQSGLDLLDHVGLHQECSNALVADELFGGCHSNFGGQSADAITQYHTEVSPSRDCNWSTSYTTSASMFGELFCHCCDPNSQTDPARWWNPGILDRYDGRSDNIELQSSIDEGEFLRSCGTWMDECKILDQYQDTLAESSTITPESLLMPQAPSGVPSVLSEYLSYQTPARIEGVATQSCEASHRSHRRYHDNYFVSQPSNSGQDNTCINSGSPTSGQPHHPFEKGQKPHTAASNFHCDADPTGDCTREIIGKFRVQHRQQRRQIQIAGRNSLPKTIHPKPPSDMWAGAPDFESSAGWRTSTSPRWSVNHTGRATLRRNLKDQFLIESKLAGMSYKDIREKGHFSEAESTLRGRFRTLTKEKQHRVRKPEWQQEDVRLLQEAVETLLRSAHGSPGSSARLNKGVKIPWKQVAEYIAKHGGSYHFGNATCRKKWDQINRNRWEQ